MLLVMERGATPELVRQCRGIAGVVGRRLAESAGVAG